MDLNALVIFLNVVKSGNFAVAASALGISRSSVSRNIGALERSLGFQLFSRTPRNVALTSAGETFFREISPHLQALQNSMRQSGDKQQTPSGLLRLSIPSDLAVRYLPGMLAGFSARYPDVQLDVHVENRRVNLIEESIDIALRASRDGLPDSALLGFELAKLVFHVYAAPAYLARAGEPGTVEEAGQHQWIYFRDSQFSELPKPLSERPLIADDMLFMSEMACAGLGLAALPSFLGDPQVMSGRLTRVLPQITISMGSLYMLHPPAKRLSIKARVFYEYLVDYLQANPLGPLRGAKPLV